MWDGPTVCKAVSIWVAASMAMRRQRLQRSLDAGNVGRHELPYDAFTIKIAPPPLAEEEGDRENYGIKSAWHPSFEKELCFDANGRGGSCERGFQCRQTIVRCFRFLQGELTTALFGLLAVIQVASIVTRFLSRPLSITSLASHRQGYTIGM
ncbi:hypothetical protein F5X96DRAFT_400063 [Biscogniauxia mediterranea]|nr:hypothetical protein F5X96DRAFT_400063 [Biscogniauxia mediterranea]